MHCLSCSVVCGLCHEFSKPEANYRPAPILPNAPRFDLCRTRVTRPPKRWQAVLIGAAIIGQDILAELNAKGYRFFPNRANRSFGGFPYRAGGQRERDDPGQLSGLSIDGRPSRLKRIFRAFRIRITPEQASKGTLIIDFIDPKKKVLLWRGWAKTNVDLKQSGDKLQALAKEAVKQILAKFPTRR